MFSILFITILTVFMSTKTFHFGGSIDVSCRIFLQEEFAEEPYVVRGRQLQLYSHETLLDFRIKLDRETNLVLELN